MPTTSLDKPVPENVVKSQHFGSSCNEPDPLIREYWARGYIRLRGLFAPEEVEVWSNECKRLLQSEFVFPKNIRTPFRMNSGDYPERIDPVVDISPIFASLASDPRITKIVQAIFRDKPLLYKDKLIFKAPGTNGYSPHQDQAWWQLCPADDILSVSIQIDGASAANGCIELFPGLHGELLTPVGLRTNLRPEDIKKLDSTKGEKIETVAGDVLMFHSLAPHQSATNTADVFRRSFYLTYSAERSGDFYQEQLEYYKTYSPTANETIFR